MELKNQVSITLSHILPLYIPHMGGEGNYDLYGVRKILILLTFGNYFLFFGAKRFIAWSTLSPSIVSFSSNVLARESRAFL